MRKVGNSRRPVVHASLEGSVLEHAPGRFAYPIDTVRTGFNDLIDGITIRADTGSVVTARSKLRHKSILSVLNSSGVTERFGNDALEHCTPVIHGDALKRAMKLVELMRRTQGGAIGWLDDAPAGLLSKLYELSKNNVIPTEFLCMELLTIGITSPDAYRIMDNTIDDLYFPYLEGSFPVGTDVRLLIPKDPRMPIASLYPIPNNEHHERGFYFGNYLVKTTQMSFLAA